MPDTERLVLDTNVVVSGMLFPSATPGRALLKAQAHRVLVSEATLLELLDVMSRARFDRYVEADVRRQLAVAYMNASETVEITSSIRACRDARDDKFLEVAVDGRADLIVTGDLDLLALNPFHGIAILTPSAYVEKE
jgi:putative PIN family toxin of toxin-antitoxin system